jgi:methyl-accepting chemotaxis protein
MTMKTILARMNNLSLKIPLMLIASVVIASLAIGFNSQMQASTALVRANTEMTNSIARYRAGALTQLSEAFEVDIGIMADSPTVREAYEFLAGVYEPRGVKDDSLHKHYVERKPPAGTQRSEYLGQDDKSVYAIGHRRWHPMLRGVAMQKKLYDLFLINPAGDVIYTVEKEPDFATNLRSGPWKSSGLARAFEGAMANAASGKAHFEEFEAYQPSNGAAAAFLAKAMKSENGQIIGVVAIQLPDNLLAAAVSKPFAEQGTAYVVGVDGRLRSAVEARGTHKLLAQTPHLALLRKAQASGALEEGFGTTLNGQAAYLAAAPSTFLGKSWFVVADQTSEDIYKDISALAMRNAAIGCGVILLLSIVSIFLARSITGPVNRMRDAVGLLATGGSSEIPGEDRSDELGELARSLRQVHEAGVAAAQIRSGLDYANVNVMIANLQGRVVYANKALLAFFRAHADSFRKQYPNFSTEEILAATLDQFHKPDNSAAPGTQRSRIRIDTLTVELMVNPIVDASGAPLGTITEWHNLTDDLVAMAEVTDVVDAAVNGDFSRRIREEGKSGAMRDLAAGQNRINTIIEGAMEEFSETLRRVAEGDLIIRVNAAYNGRLGQLANGINDTVARLAETVSTIQRSARDLNRAASEINAGATDLAQRTEEEASSLEETAATTEQLAASVKQTAEHSKVANELSEKARGLASSGGTIVHDAIHAMERIEDASKKITDIISVIDDIAFQTNLLALNAAVEAARAGDAGKGFAVVASEVRTLAQRSGQAARDIKDLIVGSATQVVEGVKLVHATGKSLDSIVMASGEVAQMIAMIHSAASEQANGIEEMSTAVARIDEMTQQNSALAEESAASASELMKQLEKLNVLVATFRIDAVPRAEAMAGRQTAPLRQASSEPDRLRQLAIEAFAQSKVPAPQADSTAAPRPQRMAAGGSRGGQDWTEF